MDQRDTFLVGNNLETLQQDRVKWKQLAAVLHANGYCWMPDTDTRKWCIARIDDPEWRARAKNAHSYRVSYAEEIWGVPTEILEHLPQSKHSIGLGYIKTDIIHPKDGKCSVLWLQHVCKTALPKYLKNQVPGETQHYSQFTNQEAADLLKEDGWCQAVDIGYAVRRNGDVMQDIPYNIWCKLPFPTDPEE